MITDPDVFFEKGCGRCARFATPDCSTQRWLDGLLELRRICLASGLSETAKWGHPCYMHGDRNIALIGAFCEDFRLNFMNPSLLKDPEGVLEKNGPNTRVAGMIRFRDAARVRDLEPVITAYLEELKGHAEAGIVPERAAAEVDLPEELVAALDADPEMAEAFAALTPGRQRSYAIVIGGAKKAETRAARIGKLRGRILAGKGATEF